MKINRNKWQTDFEKQLDISEKRQLSKVKKYYKSEYKKGIESFVSEGQTNFALLFDDKDLLKIYRDIYSDIGLRFAKWYARNNDKYLTKGVNPNQYVDQWTNKFASFGSAVGAQRVTLVSGTAKKTLIGITQQLMRDPEFMSLGNQQKGRILNSQFSRYSNNQAERLVRTEATAAANFATMESATTIFPGAQMRKEWIASFDDRTRSTHSEAGSSDPIPYNDPFMVGGSFLMYPGDPSGPAAEVINCRCSVAPFPVKAAQTVGEISDINFGMGGGSTTGIGLTEVVSAINATLSGVGDTVVENTAFIPAKTLKEAENRMLEIGGVKNVNLKGLKKAEYNEILRIYEKENRFSKLNLNSISTYRDARSNAMAVYSPSQNRISFNLSNFKKHRKDNFKTYQNQINDLEALITEYKIKYLGNTSYKQSQVISRINSFKRRINVIKFKIKDGEKARVWSISSSFEDSIESLGVTFIHEIGHFRHFKQLRETRSVGFNKRLSVSEYGRTNDKEYLAEWYAHYRVFGPEGVPEILIKLFNTL